MTKKRPSQSDAGQQQQVAGAGPRRCGPISAIRRRISSSARRPRRPGRASSRNAYSGRQDSSTWLAAAEEPACGRCSAAKTCSSWPHGIRTRYWVLTPTKLTSVTTPPGMVLPGASSASPGVADQHLLGPDADPALVAVGVRAAGRDRDVDAVHVDGDDVARPRLLIVPSIRLDWPRKLATNVAARVLVELGRRAHLLDHAGVHHRDRVGHRHGLLLVVGDVDEGEPDLGLDPLELDLHRRGAA